MQQAEETSQRLRQDLLGFLKEQAGTAGEKEAPQVTLDARRVFRMSEEQAGSSGREAVR